MTDTQNTLLKLLEQSRIDITRDKDTVIASRGRGRHRRQTALDLAPLQNYAASQSQKTPSRSALCGYAEGIFAYLAEPVRHRLHGASFVEAAGNLHPWLQHIGFGLGFAMASGQELWQQPFGPELAVYYLLEIDSGRSFLTRTQIADWSVSSDRIVSGARSMLFHRTMQGELDRGKPWDKYQLGDGYDATRATILQDLDYFRTERGVLFAMPHTDLLLIADTPLLSRKRKELAHKAHEAWETSDYPLSPELYTMVHGKPRPLSSLT